MNNLTIILGFTGSLGSGCSYISSMIPNITHENYKYYKISDIIRDILKSEGKENPTIKELQDKGNELRNANTNSYLIAQLIDKIYKDTTETDSFIIIDGIKNEVEVRTLRQFPYFYLFSIHSDRELRCKRLLKDNTFSSAKDFYEADKRDELEEYDYGQQVKKCNYLSDIIILNNKEIPHASEREQEDFIRNIYHRYIRLIEDLRNGEQSPDIFPTIDELVMTIGYSLSKMSSCLKRKVGSVIVDVDKLNNNKNIEIGKIPSIPFIVSSGYNEVPLGSYKCIFHPDYQKCYRDYLKESYAQKLKFCPNCGKEIMIKVECPKCQKFFDKFVINCDNCYVEIDFNFICSNCGIKIFDEHIPGSKKTPGKLLDMCRSLHAEEVALLKLAKGGGNYGKNLILYATTQPCNLCANKIVSAGIKEVVFAEPYLMKESAEIMKSAGVVVRRFEGIKSSAYFKLYQ
jgi:deoxycytidylate deaminase